MIKESNHLQKTVSTLLIGAAIGGVLGVLFAPNSGKKHVVKLSIKRTTC
jgi:gas vesicle protein